MALRVFLGIRCGVAGMGGDLLVTHAQYGFTALIFAARNGRTDCVRLLLDAGAEKSAMIDVRLYYCFCCCASVAVFGAVWIGRVAWNSCLCIYECNYIFVAMHHSGDYVVFGF